MPDQKIFDMPFSRVYPLLVQKAARKGHTKQEVDQIIQWISGYADLSALRAVTYGAFISDAPGWNPRAERIRGVICGVRIEAIEDPIMKRIRQLDKLIDELAKGRPMEDILR